MAYYQRHIFICVNRRETARACCQDGDADEAAGYLKDRMRELGLRGRGGGRVSTSGCLGRCGDGPVVVVYPEGVWYRYQDHNDLETIITQHLRDGEPVPALQLPD